MLIIAALAAAAAVAAAPAAPPSSPNAGATPIAGDATFKAFHGQTGIDRVVAGLVTRYQADPRIADIFKAADTAHLKIELSQQFCYVLGGGCAYDGKSMKEAHKDIGLQDADFNALVEDLQQAMDDEHVPFSAQNRLLAKLAPLRRDVVVR